MGARKPRGKARRSTAADRARQAEISPEDQEAAADVWRRDAPAGFAGLLDAKPYEPPRDRGASGPPGGA